MSDQPVEAWKNKIEWYLGNRYLKDLCRIDGEPMEFEWNKFSGFTTLGILEEIQQFLTVLQCEPEQFKDRIIFMTMHNDIARKQKNVRRNLLWLRILLLDFRSDVGHFWDLD